MSNAPSETFGAGDSFLLLDFLPLADDAFARLLHESDAPGMWQRMRHHGNDVPRLVSMQACHRLDEQGRQCIPIYRHPAEEQPDARPFVPCLEDARKRLNEVLPQQQQQSVCFNHAIVQQYRDGQDFIGAHVDKSIDIVQGTPICNLSLGAQRTLVLRNKVQPKLVQRIPLPHNSVFVLGWQTNREWTHEIRADKRPRCEKNAQELAYAGVRISATLRCIGTFLLSCVPMMMIYGQGATSKIAPGNRVMSATTDELALVQEQQRLLLHAFAAENRETAFDWAAHYGAGFDVLDLAALLNEQK